MPIRNSVERWGAISQLFHWLIVALVIAQFTLAKIADGLPIGMRKLEVLATHKSIGITILLLAVARLAWRYSGVRPPLPAKLKPWERGLARFSHVALYTLLFVIPVAGWVMSSARNFPVAWFDFFQLPDLVGPSEATFDIAHGVHETLAYALAAIALLHVAGALKHHFVYRDNVLKRMLPFTRTR